MLPYFEYTEVDKAFYRNYLAPRIPGEIFDVHIHTYLPGHVKDVPEQERFANWASECSQVLPCEDAHAVASQLYPDSRYTFAGLPATHLRSDSMANNNYLAEMKRAGKLAAAFMMVRPEWDTRQIEKTLVEEGFAGFKPYLSMADSREGETSIFSFLPHEQWEILNRNRKAVMLHIPRKERFADDDNIKELLLARNKYPAVTIIIAHLGRSYCPYYLEEGLRKLDDPGDFYFDTTAVVNPEVYDLAFTEIPLENILYGSDMHVLLWHGKRRWEEKKYYNLCREEFSWNKERRPPEEEAGYTLFLYEQVRSILDTMDKHKLSEIQKSGIFGNNARRALGL